MKKVLILASVASMIDQFNMSNIQILKELGYEVHVAANFEDGNTTSKQKLDAFKIELSVLGVVYYHIDFSRNITNISSNVKAYKKVKSLFRENKYQFVHCHSPIGGVCGRIAGYTTKTPVIYTAHGFHFYKGAPQKNWLLYYPVERWLSNYTDVLITINTEDYNRSKGFKAKKNKYIPGIGIDINRLENINVNRQVKRKEIGLSIDSFVVLSVGELNKNKNHETIIRAIGKLRNPHINYVICGQGILENYLENLIKELGLEKQIKLLGYRKDIFEICKVVDVFAFPSYREGLSVSLMEAMASGLSVVCSRIRGNSDLIENGKGGYLIKPDDVDGFVDALEVLSNNQSCKESFGEFNKNIIQKYSIEKVANEMKKIYSEV